jgi:Zn-dependent M28 family amino/carboxypeptidase
VELDAAMFPGSDYNAFIDAGIPACLFWRYPPEHPYYHSAGDTPDRLDFEVLADTASIAAKVAWRLATDSRLPFRLRSHQ